MPTLAMCLMLLGSGVITWTGDYQPKKEYSQNDAVYYEKYFYVSIVDHNAGHAPDVSPMYWQFLVTPHEQRLQNPWTETVSFDNKTVAVFGFSMLLMGILIGKILWDRKR